MTEHLFKSQLRMPAEWERHEATWLSWPKNQTTFPGRTLQEVEQCYLQMIKALAPGEKVNVLIDDQDSETRISSLLGSEKENVIFHRMRTEDVWIRDYGPIFVYDETMQSRPQLKAVKWIFDAWGKKYDDLLADNSSGMQVARLANFEIVEPKVILEGGSIDVSGKGTLLTTRQCLLNQNRNKMGPKQMEGYLSEFLGAKKVIWLGSGIEGDDTDGHVDDIARFVNDSTVLCMTDDRDGANRFSLEQNLETLKSSTDEKGKKLRIVTLQMPRKPILDGEGNPLPASYANFYIGNAAVLVPVFEDEMDQKALDVISSLFPHRKTIGINCEALVSGFGGIHCVTQQQPYIETG
jgi:agmatine deiminase